MKGIKFKMNKKVKLILEIVVFIGILCAFTGFYYFSQNSNEKKEEAASVGIIKITDDNFEQEILNTKNQVILEFTSNSCPPCVAMLTTLIDIAKNNKDIKIGTVDMNDDLSVEIIKKYEISATPTIIVFENGKVKDTLVGAVNENQIMNVLGK